jgi:two-component sensor histidine kinase
LIRIRAWNSMLGQIKIQHGIRSNHGLRVSRKGKELPKTAIGRIVEYEDSFGLRFFERVVAQREKDFKECPEKIFRNALAEINFG